MKEKKIKSILTSLGIPYTEWLEYRIGKTFTLDKHGNEVYPPSNVKTFILERLTK